MSTDQSPAAAHHVGVAQEIRSIPINRIKVLNPRVRSQKVFAGIVESIATLGLKRPITVAENGTDELGPFYDLICGQGRIEAFKALGEESIPAIVVRASEAERFLMSLVENLARRKHSNNDLLSAIRVLESRGYSTQQIAAKTNLDSGYINCILQLLKAGEDRLIGAVEQGWLPIRLAAEISRSTEADVQIALMEAYESGALRGEQLIRVRQLVDTRRALGGKYGKWRRSVEGPMTPAKLVRTFQAEAQRQKLAIHKTEMADQRLLFVVTALRRLLSDEHFRTLLRAESIGDMPKPLADRLNR